MYQVFPVPVLPGPPALSQEARELVRLVHLWRGMTLSEALEVTSQDELQQLVEQGVLMQWPSVLQEDLLVVGFNAHLVLGLPQVVRQSLDSALNAIYLRKGMDALFELGYVAVDDNPEGRRHPVVEDNQGLLYRLVGTYHGMAAGSVRNLARGLKRGERLLVLHRRPSVLKSVVHAHKSRVQVVKFSLMNLLGE